MNNTRKLNLLSALPVALRRPLVRRWYRSQVERDGEPELAWLRRLVGPGQVALDIGANLGIYSYELSRLGVRVIAFEPNPQVAAVLRSMALAGAEVCEIALSDHEGSAELSIPTEGGGFGLATIGELKSYNGPLTRVRVRAARLDSLTLPSVDFIKIDVEGHEEAVLAGARDLIARDAPSLLVEVEERHNPGAIKRISTMMENVGYSGYYLYDGRWQSLASFEPDIHQRAEFDAATRRATDYVNKLSFRACLKN